MEEKDTKQDQLQQEIRAKIESSSLEDSLVRVRQLLEKEDNLEAIKPISLGVQLALTMALEIQKGSLGQESGPLTAQWMQKFGEEKTNSAVEFARQFLTNPQTLAESIGKTLFEDQNDG